MDRRSRAAVLLAGATAAATVLSLALTGADTAPGWAPERLPPAHWPGFQAGIAIVWAVPGWVLSRRRGALPFGMLALVAGAAHATAALTTAADPGGRWTLWAASWLVIVEIPIVGAVIQLFPTGHPLPGWRWLLVLTTGAGAAGVLMTGLAGGPVGVDLSSGAPTNPLGVLPAEAGDASVVPLAVSGLAGIVTLMARFHRSAAPERRAVGLVLAVTLVGLGVPLVVAAGGRWGEAAAQGFTAVQLAFIGYVVLRYRVWGLAPMLRGTLRRVVAARDAERGRLRAELHDSIGAGLTSIRLKVDAAGRLVDGRPERAGEVLASASADLGTLVDDVRRLVDDLRPVVLEHADLATALRSRADELSAHSPGLTIVVEPDIDRDLPRMAEDAAYRIAVEALNNVVRHARATRCEVRLVGRADELLLEITDDGVGIETSRAGGIGLTTMTRRVEDLGGYLTTSGGADGGFAVRAVIPTGTNEESGP